MNVELKLQHLSMRLLSCRIQNDSEPRNAQILEEVHLGRRTPRYHRRRDQRTKAVVPFERMKGEHDGGV